MKKFLLLSLGVLSFSGQAQNAPSASAEKEWDVSLYGFVRTDYIWDTRKSANVRELNLNLYPLDEAKDANGDDKNAVAGSNFLSVVSRVGVKAKGPNVWGAKVTGTLEGDFFGNTEQSIGLFRLRHAFATLDWEKTGLTFGQTWYPAFVPEVFPGVANFSTGIMFNPFGWATQVKVRQKFSDKFSGSFTAYKEREFTVSGPGTQNAASTNSVIPTLNALLQYKNKNWLVGLSAEYKSLKPLTESATKVSDETVNSTTVFGFAKYSNDKVIVKAYGISGGNLNSFVMLGGYAGYTNAAGQEAYEPIKTTAFWLDVASNGKSVAPGIFFGMTQNNGADKTDTTLTAYGRGFSGTRGIDNVWRASARVDFKQNKFRITPELEYTAATWGDLKADKTIGENQTNVANFRAMVSCVYAF